MNAAVATFKRCLLFSLSWIIMYASDHRVLTVCEVLKNRTALNGRIVEVRGILRTTPEGSSLHSEGCDRDLKAGGYTWPAALNLSISELLTLWPPWPLNRDLRTMDQVQNQIRRQKPKPGDRIWITCIGRFESYENIEERVFRTPDGKVRANGLGHEGAFAAQLLTISTRDPVVERPVPTTRK